jgi:hypothetical protein
MFKEADVGGHMGLDVYQVVRQRCGLESIGKFGHRREE